MVEYGCAELNAASPSVGPDWQHNQYNSPSPLGSSFFSALDSDGRWSQVTKAVGNGGTNGFAGGLRAWPRGGLDGRGWCCWCSCDRQPRIDDTKIGPARPIENFPTPIHWQANNVALLLKVEPPFNNFFWVGPTPKQLNATSCSLLFGKLNLVSFEPSACKKMNLRLFSDQQRITSKKRTTWTLILDLKQVRRKIPLKSDERAIFLPVQIDVARGL